MEKEKTDEESRKNSCRKKKGLEAKGKQVQERRS